MTDNTIIKDLPIGAHKSEYVFIPRIIIAVESIERKQGKSNFLMTAPTPNFYFSFDKESKEDVLARFEGKTIYDKSYYLAQHGASQNQYKEMIDEFANDFKKMAVHPDFRALTLDTGSDLYEYVSLALFGRLTSVPPYRYAEVNHWFRENVIEPIKVSNKSLLVAYTMKKQYVTTQTSKGPIDGWSGEWERRGFKDSDGMSHLNIRLERTSLPEANFRATVLNSSQNAAVLGKTFVSNPYLPEPSTEDITGDPEVDDIIFANHKCSFPWVAQAVFPQTSVLEWL